MEPRRDKIKRVLEAFLGIEGDDMIGAVLDEDEIEIVAKAIDEALEN